MITRFETNKTAASIIEAVNACMNQNPRRRNFHIQAETGGAVVFVAPEVEDIETGGRGREFQGLRLILRDRWNNVPGYADRVADYILDILNAAVPDWWERDPEAEQEQFCR